MFFVCLSQFMFKVIKNNSWASVLNSYNFTILRYILFEKLLCFKPKYHRVQRSFARINEKCLYLSLSTIN